jgi:hypothetical protein
LFSAVLTAFVVESYTSLKPDPSQASLDLLYRISLQLPNSSGLPALVPRASDFRPAQSDVWVNALWFVSLVIALISALVAIFVKQWAREYLSWTSVSPGRDAVALRQYRHEAWVRWDVQGWRDVVATLLQLGLVLFFVGLVILLWNLNRAIAGLVTAAAGVGVGCLLVSAVLPVFYSSCPYRTPLSWAVLRVSQTIFRLAASWRTQSEQTGDHSWVQQDVTMSTNGDVDKTAFDGVLGILRANPSGKTLDIVTPCLYRMAPSGRIHYVSLSALWAAIGAVMGENLPPLHSLHAELGSYALLTKLNMSLSSIVGMSPDHAWTIAKLARLALLKQPTATLASDAIGLVHFITPLVKYQYDGALRAYHLCTLMRLLSSAPESLANAALKNLELIMYRLSESISITGTLFKASTPCHSLTDRLDEIIESKDFLEDMHSVLTVESPFLFRERGWLLAPCTLLVGLIKQLHDAKPEIVLATDLADVGSRLLPLIEKHLIPQLEDALDSDGVFDSQWLALLVDHIGEFPKLAGRLSRSNSMFEPWRLAQLSIIFSMGCHLRRLIYRGYRTRVETRGTSRRLYIILVTATLELATVLRHPPQKELLKELLHHIHSKHLLGSHEEDDSPSLRSLPAKLHALLRDFFVVRNGSKNFDSLSEWMVDEDATPMLLYKYMIQHWNAIPVEANVVDKTVMPISLDEIPQSSRVVDSSAHDTFATTSHAADSMAAHPPVISSPATDALDVDLAPPAQESLTADHPVMDPLDTSFPAEDSYAVDLIKPDSPVVAPPVAGLPPACTCTACLHPTADCSASGLPATQCALAAHTSLQWPLDAQNLTRPSETESRSALCTV